MSIGPSFSCLPSQGCVKVGMGTGGWFLNLSRGWQESNISVNDYNVVLTTTAFLYSCLKSGKSVILV